MPAFIQHLDGKFEILIGKHVRKRTAINGHRRADVMNGIEVGVVRGRDVALGIVNLRFAFGAQACPFVGINGIVRFPFPRIGFRIIQLQVISRRLHVDFRHLVFVVTEHIAHVPDKTAPVDDIAPEGQLEAPVAHGAVVERQGAIPETFRRHAHLVRQQIVAVAVIKLQRPGHPAGKEGKIHADIDRRRFFPTQIRVWRRRDIAVLPADKRARIITCRQIRRGILRDVTADTVRRPQFQHIHPGSVEKRLVVDVPAGTDRPERLVLVFGIGAPQVGTVPTDGSGQGITVVVRISRIGIERYKAVDQLALCPGGRDIRPRVHQPGIAINKLGLIDILRTQHVIVITVTGDTLVLQLLVAHLLPDNPSQVVDTVERLVHIQLLAEVVIVGRLPLCIIDISFGQVIHRLTVLSRGKTVYQLPGLERIHFFQAVHPVLPILILILGSIGQPRQEFHFQFSENTAGKVAGFLQTASQFIQRSNGHIVQTVILNIVPYGLGILGSPGHRVTLLVHQAVVRHGGKAGRIAVQQIIGLGGSIPEVDVHADIRL